MAESASNNTRKRILLLSRYLYDRTDEAHPATTQDLLDYLKECGVVTNRKTLKTDMDFLTGEDSGLDIIEVKSNPNKYFWGDRGFELPELKLLADAVASSRFITPKKSRLLVEKLGNFASFDERKSLERHIIAADSVKPLNESIYYIIDIINDAINTEHMIEFNYVEYTAEKEKVLRGNGEVYTLSPYTLYWSDDFYYVIGWSEKHMNVSSFRVDRMTNVSVSKKKSLAPPAGWNVEDYSKKVFEMYTGTIASVTMECENSLMKYVVDHFGEEVRTRVLDDKHFLTTVEVAVSPNFFSWVFTFAGKIRIISPSEVRQEYLDMARKVLNS